MNNKKDAQEYCRKGWSVAQDNDLEKAIVFYTRAIRLDKTNSTYLLHMGHVTAKQEKYLSAYSLFKQGVVIDPTNEVAYYNFGYVLQMLGRDDESIEMYKEALRLDPANADGHYNFAIMLSAQGKYEDAEEHYLRALELQPSDAYLVSNGFGCLYFLQGMFGKAIEELQKSIRLDEKFTYGYWNMSLVLFCENKSEEALKCFEDGMKTLGDNQSKTKTIKEIIKSYTSKKTRFEMKVNNSQMLNEEKTTLLRTLIHGLTEIINLLTQCIEKEKTFV